jgi:Putative auto-transporter adhesin, head GIN domain
MKIQFYMPLLAVVLFASGFTNKENEEIILNEPFTQISLVGNMKVILVERSNDNDNTVKYKNGKVTALVHNGVLVVKQKNNFLSNNEPFVVIAVNRLTDIKIKDDANVFTHGSIKTSELTLDQRGNGMVKLSVDAYRVMVYSRGTGKIQIDGNYQLTLVQKDINGSMTIEYKAKEK